MSSGAAGRLQVAGLLIAVAGALVTLAVVAWYAQHLVQYALSRGAWGGAGILPVIFALRLAVAGCVVWAVVGLDERTMLRVLLAAFGVFFLLLFGWYFLILGYDDAIFYVAVSADLLYLIGALAIGGAIVLSRTGPRPRNNHLEA
jgi:hypothetical protein